jgi:hypothetical protein
VLNRFADRLDAETWKEQGLTTYRSDPAELSKIVTDYSKGIISPPALLERQQGLVRSQGLATDGASLIFSWPFGLMRTTTPQSGATPRPSTSSTARRTPCSSPSPWIGRSAGSRAPRPRLTP